MSSLYDPDTGLLMRRTFTSADGPPLRIDFTYTADHLIATQTRYADLDGTQKTGFSRFSYANGVLTHLEHQDGAGHVLAAYDYTYDPYGRLVATTRNGQTTQYTYDASGQLAGDGTHTWSYDANGNRTLPGYVIGPGNRLLSDGTWNYAYDAEGNQIAKTNFATGETWSYLFDQGNRMTSAEQRTGAGTLLQHIDYAYDAFGMRIAQTVTVPGQAPVVTRFTYAGSEVWADLDGTSAVQTRYLRGDLVDQLFGAAAGANLSGYLTDNIGSVRDMVGTDGAVTNHLDYDPFGNLAAATQPGMVGRYTWAGREFDSATGLYHSMVGRQYDPTTGRWTGEDALTVARSNANPYRYVNNQPLSNTDPSGLRIYSAAPDPNPEFNFFLGIIRSLAITALGKDGTKGFPARFDYEVESVQTGISTYSVLSVVLSEDPIYTSFNAITNFNTIPGATREAILNFIRK